MEGTRIVLVRHGESRAQELGVVGGHAGCRGLSDLGRRQVEALAERLAGTGELAGATALYSSVMPRAVETAVILAPALGVDAPEQDCAFCEHHPGEGDGLTWDEFNRRWPMTDWSVHARRDPGGETFAEMGERVAVGLDGLVARHPGETVVVACHGGVVAWSMLRWFGIDPLDLGGRAWFSPHNASLTEWRVGTNPHLPGTGTIELVRYNDHAHVATLR